MAIATPLVRAESIYTFSSLVKASTFIDGRFGNPISGRTARLCNYNFTFQAGAPNLSPYDVHIETNPHLTMRNIANCINGVGEPGVQFNVAHPAYVHRQTGGGMPADAFHDGAGILWLTMRAYGPTTYDLDATNSDLTIPDPTFTGDRGMVEDDYIRIGSHNYRFEAVIANQEDRVLLSNDPGLDEGENVLLMRDRLVEAIRAVPGDSHRGVNYGADTVTHKTALVQPIGADGIRIVAVSPGLGGNEIEIADSGDGVFSTGQYLSGGAGDFREWLHSFIERNQCSSEIIQELNRLAEVHIPEL